MLRFKRNFFVKIVLSKILFNQVTKDIFISFHDEKKTHIESVSDFIDSFKNLTYKSLGMYVWFVHIHMYEKF